MARQQILDLVSNAGNLKDNHLLQKQNSSFCLAGIPDWAPELPLWTHSSLPDRQLFSDPQVRFLGTLPPSTTRTQFTWQYNFQAYSGSALNSCTAAWFASVSPVAAAAVAKKHPHIGCLSPFALDQVHLARGRGRIRPKPQSSAFNLFLTLLHPTTVEQVTCRYTGQASKSPKHVQGHGSSAFKPAMMGNSIQLTLARTWRLQP